MNWITRLAAQALSKHGVRTKQARQRDRYREAHNELAALHGIQIPWARKR